MKRLTQCRLCPRNCGADRERRMGYCGAGTTLQVARAALHHWEEPCISGTRGSGTVFFSHCTLQCCYCQNGPVSSGQVGKEISVQRLGEIFLELQDKGAHNINLVTGTQYIPQIIEALELCRGRLSLPIVYNTSGYEKTSTLQILEGYIDVYLPDLKYHSPRLAARYSGAQDYPTAAQNALLEMQRQQPRLIYGKDGTLQKGLIVRHLVLPGSYRDSISVLAWLKEHLQGEYLLSLMSQFTPAFRQDTGFSKKAGNDQAKEHSKRSALAARYPELTRRITTFEYEKVLEVAETLGFEGFMQEKSAAKEEYTPPFNLEGV